jgi:hypothetical protein
LQATEGEAAEADYSLNRELVQPWIETAKNAQEE